MATSPVVQTELHRHLDVSLRMSTLLELAQARGLAAQSTSLAAFTDQIVLRKPLKDLQEVLATFGLFQKVQDSPEVLERVAFEVVEDCYREGTRKAELRWAPGFIGQYNSMSWEDALGGFERGMRRALARYPDMKAGMLCIAVRDLGPDAVAETTEFYLKHRARFVGIDLAGNENEFPCRMFESAMATLKGTGARITIHAGEAVGPDNIWQAIERLGAERIGHGVTSILDPQLVEHLAKTKICLEMCPTSNWLTRAVPTFADHPLPKLLRAGVRVGINTDDPAVFGVGVDDEIRICREQMKLTAAELAQCQANQCEASFIA